MNFFIFLFLYICFYGCIQPLYTSEVKEYLKASSSGAHFPSQRQMGIEIETSTIKLKSPSNYKLGFRFSNMSNGELIWILEEDTPDTTFEKSVEFEEFDQNIEMKTHPSKGFHLAEIHNILGDMEATINWLYHNALTSPIGVSPPTLESLLPLKYGILPLRPEQTQFLIKSNPLPPEERIIKPQFTYQLPLEEISRVFMRLRDYKHLSIYFFMQDLSGIPHGIASSEDILAKIPKGPLKGLFRGMTRNKDIGEALRRYFQENIAPDFARLPENKAKGLITLFLYYWYELFNNKRSKAPEAGLKSHLGVMSRIPLSQLYANLNEHEKEIFQSFIRPHMVSVGSMYRLRPYFYFDINDESKESDGPISVADWFESIVDEHHHATGTRDLLSPPPQMTEYSMGSLDISAIASGTALIEVRGYSNLKYKEKNLTIDRITEFGIDESEWFFGE